MRLLGVFAWLAACSGNTDDVRAVAHDACTPLALATTAPTALQLQALDDAQTLWRDRGAPALGSGDAIEVRFAPAATAFHGLYEDGIIFINDAIDDEPTLAIVIAHELGHAFGLVHVTDRTSVMNPGNLATPPTDGDRDALAQRWGACQ